MDKLGRNYRLYVQALPATPSGSGELIEITLPLTIEFDVTRNTLTSANVCQVRIYNLSRKTRERLHRNITNFGPPFQSISLEAGYGQNLAQIFAGNISHCWSVREGVNYITQIECFDGGFAFVNGYVNTTVKAGASTRDAVKAIANTPGALPYVKVGAIGDYPTKSGRQSVYTGNTMQVLSTVTGGGAFIDNGYVNALGTEEYINDGGIIVIGPGSGLLGTPLLEQYIVRFDMLFEPKLNVARQVSLESITAQNGFNGLYKITAIKHRGMISESVCGAVVTTGEFFKFEQPKPVKPESRN